MAETFAAGPVGQLLSTARLSTLTGRIFRRCRRYKNVRFDNARRERRTRSGGLLINERTFHAALDGALTALLTRTSADDLGDYLEFGVGSGSTLTVMYHLLRSHGADRSRLFGFDSFEGLPAEAECEDGNLWFEGQFACPEVVTREALARRGIPSGQIILRKGWFLETLNADLIAEHHLSKASVVMIASTLYSSAKTALEFCRKLFADNALIMFDTYFPGGRDDRFIGEEKAFVEFLDNNREFVATILDYEYSPASRIFLLQRRHSGSSGKLRFEPEWHRMLTRPG